MIINPNDSTHTLSVIPRYYPVTALTLYVYNEATKVSETPANSYTIYNGKLKVTFDYTFVENDKHQIKITDNNGVIYRGGIIATTKDTQTYKLTEGVYFY